MGVGGSRRVPYARTRLGVVASCALVSLLFSPAPAAAQIPNDSSAVDQYVEAPSNVGGAIPGAGANGAGGSPGAGAGGGPAAGVPQDVRDRIARLGGEDAPILEQIATNPAYGAPQRTLGDPVLGDPVGPDGGRPRPDAFAAGTADGDVSDALGAAVSAVQGGDAGRLVGLLFALLAISVATLAAAGVRQRSRTSR